MPRIPVVIQTIRSKIHGSKLDNTIELAKDYSKFKRIRAMHHWGVRLRTAHLGPDLSEIRAG